MWLSRDGILLNALLYQICLSTSLDEKMPSRKHTVVGQLLLVDLLFTVIFNEDLWDCGEKHERIRLLKTVTVSMKEQYVINRKITNMLCTVSGFIKTGMTYLS